MVVQLAVRLVLPSAEESVPLKESALARTKVKELGFPLAAALEIHSAWDLEDSWEATSMWVSPWAWMTGAVTANRSEVTWAARLASASEVASEEALGDLWEADWVLAWVAARA